MNERIRELAIGCAIQLDWDFPSDPKEYTFSSVGVEKFAELIVKECAEVLDTSISPPSHPMNSLGYKLKEHFGVDK